MYFNSSDTGYWNTPEKSNFYFNESLCFSIAEYLTKKKLTHVFDFGCGTGEYCHILISLGFPCLGFDGNPHTGRFTKFGAIRDLAFPVFFVKRDCVISIDVGQYIPKQYEMTFIDNLCNNTKHSIIVKWSSNKEDEKQINCVDSDYLISEFLKRGFKLSSTASYEISNLSKNKILVFERINNMVGRTMTREIE
jgi:hypothetical protein